jgi:hypothetical protein
MLAASLALDVPEAISEPSLRCRLLSKSYVLDLALHFDGVKARSGYITHELIPITIVSETPCIRDQSEGTHDSNDELGVGIGFEDASTPPPPYASCTD